MSVFVSRAAQLALLCAAVLAAAAPARSETLLAWWSFNNTANDSDLTNATTLDGARLRIGHMLDNNPPFDDGFYDPVDDQLFPVHDNFSCPPGALVDDSGFQNTAGVPPESLFRAYIDVSGLVGNNFPVSNTDNNWGAFGGTGINRPCGTSAGNSLAITGTQNNGHSFAIHTDLTGQTGIQITWAEQGTATGYTTRTVEVSPNCANPSAYTQIFIETTAPTSFAARSAVDTGHVLDGAANACIRFTVSGASGSSGNNRFDNIQLLAGTPAPITATIPQIQGSGTSSPFVNQVVQTTGVVTLDLQGANQRNGFFLQDPNGDGNDATSDGIFVFSTTPVSAGQEVTVTGTVVESSTHTQIVSVSSILVLGPGAVVPYKPIALPEPTDGFLERYEGMKVEITSPLTVAQNFFLGRFGQLTLAGPNDAGQAGRLWTPTNLFDAGSPAAISLRDENARRLLVLDDDQDIDGLGDNPNPVPYIGAPPPAVLRGGDALTGSLFGVLDYGLINSSLANIRDYRLQPTVAPVFASQNPRPSQPPQVGGTTKIATFNVLNYFTTFGSRGASNAAEFTRQRNKIFDAMKDLDADVLGLMEIQNNGNTAVADLVSGLNAVVGAGTYDFISTGTVGTDEIKVALIYKPARIQPVGSHEIFDEDDDPNALTGFNRPALLQRFREIASNQTFLVALNHFKSKGSACDSLGDFDLNDGQGNCNQTRLHMATAQAAFLNTYAAGLGERNVFILGDLNSYGAEDPIQALEAAGYRDLVKGYQGPAGYSYTFDGEIGRLDYILANASARSQVVNVSHWHINTDEPQVIDYDQNFNPPGYYTADEFRASDHDINVAGLALDSTVDQDQFFEPASDTTLSTASAMRPTQTFVASSAGQLLQVDLLVSRQPLATDPLTVEVYRTSAGLPTGTAVASMVVSSAHVGTQESFVHVDLRGANLQASSGETLAIVLSSTGDYRWSGRTAGGYASGQALVDPGSGFGAVGSTDLGFRTYLKESAAVPVPALPGILALVLAGLLLGSACAPRRRSA